MSRHLFARGALAAAIASLSHGAFAQATLKEVTVTANPLGSTDLPAAATQLSGQQLLLRGQGTLGQVLDGLPGVSSTYFGPTASRPVIRGLDGDRVRILNNSGAALDASSLSYDHAVAADPITVERVEVLRGPGALLYGGNAIGGVVNLIDNRIPREPVPGIAGRADLGFASGNREKSGALLVEGGSERIGLHADIFRRHAGDTRVPVELACTQGGITRTARRICNSAGAADGGAVGASLFFDQGFLGASLAGFDSRYGAVAEDEVTVDMRSEKLAVEGELRGLKGPLQSISGRLGHGHYRHTELEAGVAGTEFRNDGSDLRLQARHAPLGPLQGVIGLQAESTRFAADGAEAFAPHSRTREQAIFAHEELPLPWGKLTLGARAETVRITSLGSPSSPRFLPAERSFRPRSAALGVVWNAAPAWQLTGNLARSERAPRDYELFADGPHVATGAYEVGNANLPRERSTHVEAGVAWKSGAHRARVQAYAARFQDFIALAATGVQRDGDGNSGVTDCGDGTSAESGCAAEVLPEYAWQAVPARFRGLEADGVLRVLGGARTLDVEWRADLVRATNTATGQPLPRIAPARVGATLVLAEGPWSARLGFDHSARQSRVPAGELPVAGATLWQAAVTWRQQAAGATLLWYARLQNAGDRLAYSATSLLTQSAPGRVPLPGRSLKLGVQAAF